MIHGGNVMDLFSALSWKSDTGLCWYCTEEFFVLGMRTKCRTPVSPLSPPAPAARPSAKFLGIAVAAVAVYLVLLCRRACECSKVFITRLSMLSH